MLYVVPILQKSFWALVDEILTMSFRRTVKRPVPGVRRNPLRADWLRIEDFSLRSK